ncbi:unnamed protein product, partial [Didymodactylos carnosus]
HKHNAININNLIDEDIEAGRQKQMTRLENQKLHYKQHKRESFNIDNYTKISNNNLSDKQNKNEETVAIITTKSLFTSQNVNSTATSFDIDPYLAQTYDLDDTTEPQCQEEEEYSDIDFDLIDTFDTAENNSTYDNSNNEDNNEICTTRINNEALHSHTMLGTNNVCIEFLQLVRDSQISKHQAQRFQSFINNILPQPNAMPNTMGELLTILNITNYFYKRTVCILCKRLLNNKETICDKCPTAEAKHTAQIYDTNFPALLSVIVSRLAIEIHQYKQQISALNPNEVEHYDIPFGQIYQQLLKQRMKQNLLSLLIQLDGIGLVKSTNLKMWLCSAAIIELPPNIRSRRHNMPLLSIYIGHTEPHVKLWLSSCFDMLKFIKQDGMITIAFYLLHIRENLGSDLNVYKKKVRESRKIRLTSLHVGNALTTWYIGPAC